MICFAEPSHERELLKAKQYKKDHGKLCVHGA